MARTSADILIDVLRRRFGQLPIVGAEVGVSCGATSRALLIALPALHLYMVDAWATYEAADQYRKSGDGHARLSQQEQEEHRLEADRVTSFARTRRGILHMPSVPASKTFVLAELDFTIIDADHTRVAEDIDAWWPKVRPGGLMLGHDIDHPRDRRGLWTVRRDVTAFCMAKRLTFQVEKDVWWVEKPEE